MLSTLSDLAIKDFTMFSSRTFSTVRVWVNSLSRLFIRHLPPTFHAHNNLNTFHVAYQGEFY